MKNLYSLIWKSKIFNKINKDIQILQNEKIEIFFKWKHRDFKKYRFLKIENKDFLLFISIK